MTDSNAMVIETYKYDLNGTPTIYDPSGVQDTDGISAIGNRIMFGGRDYYRELELYNFRNRFYLPEVGRFLQPDPIGFAGDPANLYRYCANNPVNWSDPTGLGNKSDGGNSDIPLGSHIPVPSGQSLGNAFYFPSGYASTNGWGSVSGTPTVGGRGSSGDNSLTMGWTYPDGHQGPPPPDVETERIWVYATPLINPLWGATLGDIFAYGSNTQLGHLVHYNNEHPENARNRVRFANAVDRAALVPAAAVAVWAAPVVPSLLSQLGEAAVATPEAIHAGVAAARPVAARVTTYVYLGVVAPTISLNVNNPHVREILEEAYEEWKLYGPR